MQPFSVRPGKGVSTSQCREMSRMMLRGLKGNGFVEEAYGQRLWHTSSGSVKKDTFSFLPVCFRLCTKAKCNRKTAQSLKKQYLLPSLGLQCVFVSAGLFGRKLKNRNTQWTLVLELIPVFLADPWTPAPTAPLPGLPGAPVFLLKRLLKKLASTPSLAAPAAEESEQKPALIATITTKQSAFY